MHKGWKIATAVALMGSSIPCYSQTTLPSQQVDITGTWGLDKTYARDYFTEGAKLQQRWCGISWPDAEIERRIQTMERTNDIISQITLQKLNDTTYQNTTVNDTDPPKARTLSNCATVGGRLQCDTGDHQFGQKGYPDLDKAYFRREKQYLFVDVPTHKTMMKCPKAKEPPEQSTWVSFRYKKLK